MKAYRIIGSLFSSLLMPIFIILLCASILVVSAANLITEKSINAIVKNTMQNEEMKAAVSDTLINNIYSGENADSPEMKEAIDQIMELPSIQNVISNIVSNSADEITSGNFDGELNIQEKLEDSLTEDPELLPTLSEDVVNVLLENDSFRTSLAQSFITDASVTAIGEDVVDMLLQEPAVKTMIAQIVTYSIENNLGIDKTFDVDIAQGLSDMIAENPTLAQSVAEISFPDSQTFDAAVAEATAFANKTGQPAPQEGISQVEFLQYYLEIYGHNINDAVKGAILNAETDRTDYAPDAAPDAESQSNDLSIKFDDETVATLNEIAAILNVFKSPLFILAILSIFLFYYLFAALLTWSFRYPLIFSGIASIITGISLIVIAMIPISDILAASAGEGAENLVFALIASIWGVLANKLLLIGTLGIVLGIALITVFIITHIMIKNKALKESISETEPISIA